MFSLNNLALTQSLMNNRRVMEKFYVIELHVMIQNVFAVYICSLSGLTICRLN